MAVFLDVLPRLGLTEAEVAFSKLKEMAAKTGKEMGLSLGDGATAGLDKLKESAISAERTVSEAHGKMAKSAGLNEAAQKKVAETTDLATKSALAYADAQKIVADAGVATLAQAKELESLRARAVATDIAATKASAAAVDMSARATAASLAHGDAELTAAAASTKFAAAKDNSSRAVTSMAGVLNGIGVASFVGFGAAMGATASKAADFEQSQTKLVAAAGETSQGLKQISDGILQLAGQVGYSAGALSDAMFTVEKAGFDASKGGLDVLKAAAQGANAEQADLSEVTKGLTISMNDFHFSTQKAADIMSKLVVATGASGATFQEFTGALHSVEPAAAAAGIKYEDLLATIARGTKSGASADQVTENIRNAINSLSGAQGPARAAMQQLGISADDLSQHLRDRGLAGSFQYLADTIKAKMDPNHLIPTGVFKQNAQELDNMTASLQLMSPAAQQVAEGYRNGTVKLQEFRNAVKGASGDDIKRLQDFKQWSDDLDDFSKRYKNGQSTLETYNQALRDVTGTVAGQTIALQVTGDNATATNDLIAKLTGTTQTAEHEVVGFRESQETLNGKMRDAKAAFGAAAIEMGDLFIPALKGAADGLKATAEFLAQHKTLMQDAEIAVGAFGITWAAVKVSLAARGVWDALAGGIDLAVNKFAALRAASLTTAGAIEADAAAEATAITGIGSAALASASALGAMALAIHQLNSYSPDADKHESSFSSFWDEAKSWMSDGYSGTKSPNLLPVAAADQYAKPGAQAERAGGRTHDYAPPGTVPPPPSGPLPIPTPDASADPGVAGWGVGGTAPKAKKGDAKNDPIWIAPADSKDFKPDTEHGVTGSSIIENGPDFSPKGIGTFFSALLIDLALGNPLGKTMADKQKRGDSAQNPMYVTTVDVDNAQKKLDDAIHSYGPDSTEAKTAAAKLAGTQAAVGTTGGYYNPQTGAISASSSDIAVPGGGKGAEAWRGTVQQTVDKYAAQMGIPADKKQQWVDSIVSQIGTESHGDPNADNPHDSDGQGGTQHVAGLLQYLPSSYANSGGKLTGLPMMDPVGQIAGALFAPRNADGTPAHGGAGIGGGHGWGPTSYNPGPATAPAPAATKSGDGGGGWYGSILDNLRNEFTGGGGLGPVFNRDRGGLVGQAAGMGVAPPGGYNGGPAGTYWLKPGDTGWVPPFTGKSVQDDQGNYRSRGNMDNGYTWDPRWGGDGTDRRIQTGPGTGHDPGVSKWQEWTGTPSGTGGQYNLPGGGIGDKRPGTSRPAGYDPSLRSEFTGGGGLGPVFKRSPASGGPNTPGPYDNSPAAVAAREAADPAFQHLIGHDVDATGRPRAAGAPSPGGSPFDPGGALSAIPGAPGFTPGIPGAPGGLGPQAPGFAPLSLNKGSPGGGVGASALLGAGTGAAPKSGGDKPGVGSSVANTPAKWGSGKGASVSVGSSIIAAAGPLAAMAPGSAQAAQLIDRTIGYGAQVGGIAVEGLMSSLIPGGTGGGGIGDPSKSVLGKIAGGIAGAHKTSPNTAGKVAPPTAGQGDGKQQPPQGGDTTHVGSQNNGVQVMGDMHVSTPDAGAMKTDVMKQQTYPTATR